MSLGSIFEPDDRPAGRDLSWSVEVPRWALGQPYVVDVPLEIEVDGERATRAVGPGEIGSKLTLNLAADIPERTKLRLRGVGEVGASGRAGDLYLTVTVVEGEPPPARRASPLLIATLFLFILGSIAWAFAR